MGPSAIVGSGDNPPNGTAAGAIEAIAVDPTNPNDIFAGAVGGGIWKTTNGGQTWTPLIDNRASISISSLAFDPTDSTHRTLIAGTGATSNGGFGSGSIFATPANFGGLQNGLLYSQDNGATWSRLGASTLAGQSVVDVAARGATILAATFEPRIWSAGTPDYSGGLYRSTDGGATFTAVSGAPGSGLPAGAVSSMVGDPSNPNKFYAAVVESNNGTFTGAEIYVSTDRGATWTVLAGVGPGEPYSFKLAAGPGGTLAVGQVDLGTRALSALYYSNDGFATWTTLTAPNVNQGGQAPVNIALAIDPTRPNLIYVEGDNNYYSNGGINALAITRVDANTDIATAMSDDSGSPVNTANGSSVHPDGRVLVIDSSGRLLTGTDGGLYARTSPQDATGVWLGLNGNMAASELYAAAFDANSKRIVVSAQDNGSSYQSAPGSLTSNAIGGGDGTNVAINDRTLGNLSAIYTSAQELGGLQRLIVDRNGTIVSPASGVDYQTGIPVNFDVPVVGVGFNSPFVLNNIDPTRIAVGGLDVYVTQDTLSGANGPTATSVNLALTDLGAADAQVSHIDYGTRNNPDALIAGAIGVFLSTTATAGSLQPLPSYAGLDPTAVKFDPRSDQRFFVADSVDLYGTVDQGTSFKTLTANLPANFIRPTSLGFIDNNGVDALLVGGLNNADNAGDPLVVADSDPNGALSGWRRFGSGLPNTTITSLSYNFLSDTLTVGTAGRSAWLMYDVTSNFPQATVLQFGLADNNSTPDPSILTNGIFSQRPLIKYGTGVLTITGLASYTGATDITAGTLALTGAGSIASSSGVAVSKGATFDISQSAGAAVQSLSGLGSVALGGQTLSLTNASGVFGGVMSGSGGLTLGGGTETLSGANAYTGATDVLGGTLALKGAGSIASSSGVGVSAGATFDISRSTNGASIESLSGLGSVALGRQTLRLTNASGVFGGVMSGSGGLTLNAGAEILTGANTYTGTTTVIGGALTNLGLINAVAVNAGGAFNQAAGGAGPVTARGGSTVNVTGGVIAGPIALTLTGGGAASTINIFGGALESTAGAAILANGGHSKIKVSGAPAFSFSNGDLLQLINSSNVTFTATGATLTGNIVSDASSTGVVDLTMGSVLTGMIDPVALTIDSASRWNVTGNSSLTTLTNAGTVAYLAPADPLVASNYYTVTVNNYVGQNGKLLMNASVGGPSTLTDQLIINGGTATGSTTIYATVAGLGAATAGNGLPLVSAINGATTTSNAFTLGNSLAAGAYAYKLSEVNSSWYLTSYYRPEVAADSAVEGLASRLGLAMLGTLDERIGASAQANDPFAAQPGMSPAEEFARFAGWSRTFGEWGAVKDEGFASDYTYSLGGFQAGLDMLRSDKSILDGGRDVAGVYLGVARIESDIHSASASAGMAGHTDMNGYSLGAYWTHYAPQSWYTDAVLQGTRYADIHANSLGSVADQAFRTQGYGFLASLETGYRLGLGNGWAATPQAQLIYQNLSFDGGGDAFGQVGFKAVNNGYGRLGLKVSKDWAAGWLTPDTSHPARFTAWARANVWQAIGGQGGTTFATLSGLDPVTVKSDIGQTWGGVDLGVSGRLTGALSAFALADYNFAINDGAKGHSLGGKAGIEVTW